MDDDADTLVQQFYEQQQKLCQQFNTKEKRTPKGTIKISQAREIKEFAANLTRAFLT